MPDLYELALSLVTERLEANVLGSDVTVTELIKSLKRTTAAAMEYEKAHHHFIKEAKNKRQALQDAEALMAARTAIEAEELAQTEQPGLPSQNEQDLTRTDEEIQRYQWELDRLRAIHTELKKDQMRKNRQRRILRRRRRRRQRRRREGKRSTRR